MTAIVNSKPQLAELWVRYGIDAFMLISFFYISLRISGDVAHGGNSWKQGDWLINSINVDVRRAFTGNIFIYLSDEIGINLLKLVAVTQFLLLGFLFLGFRALLRRLDPCMVAILVASPAIFTVFWVADPQGSVRKELLTFLGLILCGIGTIRERNIYFAAGAVILSTSFMAHEAMVLFLPMLWAIVLLSWRPGKQNFTRLLVSVVTSLFAIFAFYYAVRNSQVPSTSLVCQPLLERGFSEDICGGAIRWLKNDMDFALNRVVSQISAKNVLFFAISYVMAAIPFLYLLSHAENRFLASKIFFLTPIPFLPLYFISIDWGRWMSFHIFSIVLLTSVAMQIGQLRLTQNLNPVVISALILAGLLLSPDHAIEAHVGGALRRLTVDLWNFYL